MKKHLFTMFCKYCLEEAFIREECILCELRSRFDDVCDNCMCDYDEECIECENKYQVLESDADTEIECWCDDTQMCDICVDRQYDLGYIYGYSFSIVPGDSQGFREQIENEMVSLCLLAPAA